MCKPEMASRWAKFDLRRALTCSCLIPDLLPVIMAAANPDVLLGRLFCKRRENFIRYWNNFNSNVSAAGCNRRTRLRVYPTAPSFKNQACRRKSNPSGSTGLCGGIIKAVVCMIEPGSKFWLEPLARRDRRIRCGVRPEDIFPIFTLSSVILNASELDLSISTTRPSIGP